LRRNTPKIVKQFLETTWSPNLQSKFGGLFPGTKTWEEPIPQNILVHTPYKFMKPQYIIVISVIISLIVGFAGGVLAINYYPQVMKVFGNSINTTSPTQTTDETSPKIIEKEVTSSQEEQVIKVVNDALPSVVSIIAEGEIAIPGIPFFSQQIKSGGTGFIISSDGLILTNKHVVQYENINYTVILSNNEQYPAKVLARASSQDLAVLKIDPKSGESFTPLPLGDSDNLKIGQTVIAIGNALGEFQNSVSVGVVSGLSRSITASGGGIAETLDQLIQTDAAINSGNSGGPLLNLSGEIIGINTAVASGAENIGFAIPINQAKKAIESVKATGKITYPFLGVRHVLIDENIQKQYNLPVDYGAWVVRGSGIGDVAVTPGSAADKAGLKENDIILEIDGQKITTKNTLSKIILSHNVGDKIKLKILRNGKEMELEAQLGEQ